MTTAKKYVIVAICGVLIVTALLLQESEVQQPPTVLSNAPASAPNTTPRGEETSPVPPNASSEPQKAPFSLHAKVRELSSSPNPADSFRAYNILVECKWAKEEQRSFNLVRQADRNPTQTKYFESGEFAARLAQACGDIQESDFGQRLPLVERAAAAGIPLAAIHLTNEGPWGDMNALYTRPKDPLVLEWRQRVSGLIKLAANKGDVAALASLADQYATGSGVIGEVNPKLAIQYTVAQNIVYEAQVGKPMMGRERRLKELTTRVSPAVADQAQLDGKKMAADVLGEK